MLRSQDGAQNLIISAAASIIPFVSSDGNSIPDVSGFAEALNYTCLLFPTFNFVPV